MDDSAVAHPHEAHVHMDDAGEVLDVQGPETKVNGQLYEETQFCLGGFADWDATVVARRRAADNFYVRYFNCAVSQNR